MRIGHAPTPATADGCLPAGALPKVLPIVAESTAFFYALMSPPGVQAGIRLCMSLLLRDLAAALDAAGAVAGKLAKQKTMAELLVRLADEDLTAAVRFCNGRAFGATDERTIGVSSRTLAGVLIDLLDVSADHFRTAVIAAGEIGEATAALWPGPTATDPQAGDASVARTDDADHADDDNDRDADHDADHDHGDDDTAITHDNDTNVTGGNKAEVQSNSDALSKADGDDRGGATATDGGPSTRSQQFLQSRQLPQSRDRSPRSLELSQQFPQARHVLPPVHSPALTLDDLSQAFAALATTTQPSTKRAIVRPLLARCGGPREAAYLVKIILSDLRTGVREGVLQAAVAQAFGATLAQVQRAQLLVGDLGTTAVLARRGALASARFVAFHPIGFMLAGAIESPGDVPFEVPFEVPSGAPSDERSDAPLGAPSDEPSDEPWDASSDAPSDAATCGAAPARVWMAEDKLDGIRAQVHKQGDRIAIYTRTLDRTDESFPDVVDAVQGVPGDFVIDGEIVPMRDGRVLPFGVLQKRLGRKSLTTALLEASPCVLVAFDLLWSDGVLQMDEPLTTRRAELTRLLASAGSTGDAGHTSVGSASGPLDASTPPDGTSASPAGAPAPLEPANPAMGVKPAVEAVEAEIADRAVAAVTAVAVDGADIADKAAPALPPARVRLSVATPVASPEAVGARFDAAREAGNEGLVLKASDSIYSPGRRGGAWLKLKTHLPTLDCVITAGEYGHGKRRNTLSDYTFGVWDRPPETSGMYAIPDPAPGDGSPEMPRTSAYAATSDAGKPVASSDTGTTDRSKRAEAPAPDAAGVQSMHGQSTHGQADAVSVGSTKSPADAPPRLLNIGKAFSGVTDEEILQLTELLKSISTGDNGRVFVVPPRVVLEIAFDQIQPSRRHASGFALRFPRIKRVRWDKRPADADTLARAREVYEHAHNFARQNPAGSQASKLKPQGSMRQLSLFGD